MQYKTIIMNLLEMNPQLYEQLGRERLLLAALDHYSTELKTRHEAWKERITQAKPGSSQSQISSEAMEIAVKELQDRLLSGLPADENSPLSLDGAMAYIRSHLPPA